MLTVNRRPSPAQLRSFGVLLALFVTVVGGAAQIMLVTAITHARGRATALRQGFVVMVR